MMSSMQSKANPSRTSTITTTVTVPEQDSKVTISDADLQKQAKEH